MNLCLVYYVYPDEQRLCRPDRKPRLVFYLDASAYRNSLVAIELFVLPLQAEALAAEAVRNDSDGSLGFAKRICMPKLPLLITK